LRRILEHILERILLLEPAGDTELNEMTDPVCMLMGDILPEAVRGQGAVAQLLREGGLYSVFQPIADLKDGSIHAHEALIRGPQGSPLHTPDALLHAAQTEGLLHELEVFCLFTAVQRWGVLKQPGRIF
jgi:EAL domain-containing protein (putative c-di-GMP-specific phosphodiesterase class I)